MASRNALTVSLLACLAACATPEASPAERAQPHFEAGVRTAEAGEWDRAVGHFSRALEQNPGFADAYFRRGSLRLKLVLRGEVALEGPEIEKAVEDFSAALRIYPLHFEASYNRGLALAALSRYREAAQDLRQAVQSRDVELQRDAHARLGEILEEKFVEMDAQARSHYEKYAELGGKDPAVFERLSVLRDRSEKSRGRAVPEKEAETLLFEALRLGEAGQKAEAIRALEKAAASGALNAEKKSFATSVLAQWQAEAESEAAAAGLLKEARALLKEGKRELAVELLAHASRKYARTRVVLEEVAPLLKELADKKDK